MIGEDPQGTPNNLMPFLTQVAVGRRPYLSVFGNDYPTTDGTGVRDYIHVTDLAQGHVAALENGFLRSDSIPPSSDNNAPRFFIFNLGSGYGTSVLQLLHALEKACGKKLEYKFKHALLLLLLLLLFWKEREDERKLHLFVLFTNTRVVPRREGDIAEMYADSTLAEKSIHWKAKLSVEKACKFINFKKKKKKKREKKIDFYTFFF
ncbi:UDP-glucose 4-epimerase [Reticulomyxa filosa]|uniref:UDP-glucose 4-epimerase n=1 Tax=Reticulomyxa filosa TaxID=46433 RepID=X6N3M4_RETFI|nr:UDP-glucose 4-epimerase [Reticulomyxa filosa]|eukprot:ETO20503.1 UDP-glucose 4-epimerase [Reticulomyxa filosa]